MTRSMYRYEIPADDQPHTVKLAGAPVAVATIKSYFGVEFWAEHHPDLAETVRAFQVFGTGHPLPDDARWIGTCPRDEMGLVWHLYEVTP